MRNINNKLFISLLLGVMTTNGCVSEGSPLPPAPKKIQKQRVDYNLAKKQSIWKNTINKSSKEECPECYADILKPKRTNYSSSLNRDLEKIIVSRNIESENGYNYETTSADTYGEADKLDALYQTTEVENTQPHLITQNCGKKSIQVGAFRRHAGAETYADKYRTFVNKYNVAIKKNIEQNRPMYRVQIEGFSSAYEARNFIARNSITGAFLVQQ